MRDIREQVRNGEYSFESFLIQGQNVSKSWDYDHHVVPPISSSSTYRLSSAERGAMGFGEFPHPSDTDHTPIYIYERLDDPTRGMLEENLALLEGGEIAVAFSTGMAAISAALGILLERGDKLVAHQTLYGCTHSLMTNWLPRNGIEVDFVDLTHEGVLAEAIDKRTKAIYLETPSNPTLELIDLSALRTAVDAIDPTIPILVDNTFATPYCQRPLSHGATFVIHSLTKNLNGFGTELGGIVIGPKQYEEALRMYRKDFGASLSGKSAWPVLVYGLPSLAIRLQRQQTSALQIAQYLEKHSLVRRVYYPGLRSFPQRKLAQKQMRDFEGNFAPGNMLYFELDFAEEEGARNCRAMLDFAADNAYCMTLAVSLGQVRTLIESPVLMTHSGLGAEQAAAAKISRAGIRLSVGLENPSDIIRDLSMALNAIRIPEYSI